MARDPEIVQLKQKGVRFAYLEFSFGLIKADCDAIALIDEQIEKFRASSEQSIFVFFVGLVDHWVSFVVMKKAIAPDLDIEAVEECKASDNKSMPLEYYFMDSLNYD